MLLKSVVQSAVMEHVVIKSVVIEHVVIKSAVMEHVVEECRTEWCHGTCC